MLVFQSTQPEWAATGQPDDKALGAYFISIHAARVGCDQRQSYVLLTSYYFNPRSPSGLRLHKVTYAFICVLFQSTQPEWAATDIDLDANELETISIHAARVGCDRVNQV